MTIEELKAEILAKFGDQPRGSVTFWISQIIENEVWPPIEAELVRLNAIITALVDQSWVDRDRLQDENNRLRRELAEALVRKGLVTP